jgi:predicted ATPase/DNA-binding SARP family transcriptional activator
VDDPARLAQHVVTAFGIREELPPDPAAPVRLLHDRSGLLVLDNCEHLVDACAALVEALLRGCPGIRVLATSREALGVRGERAWLVPPLTVPDPGLIERAAAGAPDALAAAESADAMRLFVERAVESTGGFQLNAGNVAVVADICRRLDGIPLAIELAAARVRHIGVEQIRDRLHDVFALLKSGVRTAVPRHRTLAATLDWSHDLLSPQERALFRRLAVFRGGFTLPAVEEIGLGTSGDAAASDTAMPDVIDVLGRLVDRSLVSVREQSGGARYGMLETVLQYARRRLEESGEYDDVRRRHARHVASLIDEAEPHLTRPERRVWVERLLADLENIRDALDWTREHEAHLHVRMVGQLWWFWFSSRYWTEARRVIDAALALPEAAAPDLLRARLLFSAGALAALQSRNDVVAPLLEEATAIAREHGDGQLEAYAMNYHGMLLAGLGQREAWDLCLPAAAWFESSGDLYGLRLARLLLGTSAMGAGDFDEAERQVLEGVRIARLYRQDRELAIALQTAAIVYLARGELDAAEAMLLESIAASRRDPAYFAIGLALETLGELWCRCGRVLEGARLLGAGEATRRRVDVQPYRFNAVRLAEAVPGFRNAVGAAAFDRAWAEGARLTPEAAMDEALAVGGAAAAAAVVDTRTVADDPVALAGHAASEPATADLYVRALGSFEVRVGDSAVDGHAWTYAKPKELLTWLLLHTEGGTRDVIARALWPASAPAQSKNSFHVTVHNLRRTLGHPEWVVLERDRYRLAPDILVDFDARRFEQGARAVLAGAASPDPGAESRIRELIGLYRGDLLEDEPAGEWHEEPRADLRRRFVDLQMLLGDMLERTGDTTAAADAYYAITIRDELHEEAHRRLMSCWARAGDRTRAIRHYDRLVAVLREVLDADPDDATIELAEQIRRGATAIEAT